MIAAKKMLLAGGLKVGPLVPIMTSATAPRGTVARSSYFGTPFFEAWKVFAATAPNFDPNGTDQFAFGRTGTNGNLPHWLSYDFGVGNSRRVQAVDLASFNAGVEGSSGGDAETRLFRIEGSNDGATWVGTPNFEHSKDQSRVLQYNFASIGKFRFWRLRVLSCWSPTDTTAIIQKLQFFERRA